MWLTQAESHTLVTKAVASQCVSNHPEGLIKDRFLSPSYRVSDFIGLGRSIDLLSTTPLRSYVSALDMGDVTLICVIRKQMKSLTDNIQST